MVSIGTRALLKSSLSSGQIQPGRAVKFMGAASAVACAIALSSAAAAQSVPSECAPSPLAPGSTILCVAPGTIAGPFVSGGVDDLTVVIGDADNVTTLTSGEAGTAVDLVGAGAQTLTVNAGSAVTGTDVGAYIEVTGGAGALTVNSPGTISGGITGIQANNDGTGVTSITTADVNGGTGRGIDVNGNGGGDVIVDTTAGTVTGGTYGIYVDQGGIGNINITTANVTGGDDAGIYAWTSSESAGNVVIDTTAGEVSGSIGIDVENNGSGGVSLTTANVIGTSSDAIQVSSGSYYGEGGASPIGGDIVINTVAGTVTGDSDGIDVNNTGLGGVFITTADVVALGDNGIEVRSGSYFGEGSSAAAGGDIVINTVAGRVRGADNGIEVDNYGLGGISITTADVTSVGETYTYGGIPYTYGDSAIEVNNSVNSTGGVTINTVAGTVDGFDGGIDVDNRGAGGVSITTAAVLGGESFGIAVYNSENSAGGVAINTVAGAVSGDEIGIVVQNDGAGAVSITTANVSGGEWAGITVYNGENAAGGVAINTVAGAVSGGEAGISVQSSGTGGISITTADVSATGGFYGEGYSPFNGVGIRAQNGYGSTGDIVIDSSAGTVTGAGAGIYAANQGQGGLDITAADVSGGFVGVVAINRNYGGEGGSLGGIAIDTTAGAVTGGDLGIIAMNDGTGGISITTADVSATGLPSGEAYTPFAGTGIRAQNMYGATGDIVIDSSAGTVTAAGIGIYADNLGEGSISITTADVSGGFAGVVALNRGYYYGEGSPVGDIEIDTRAGAVTGEYIGIAAFNEGTGSIAIAAGDVTGGYVGIQASTTPLSEGGIAISSVGTVRGDDFGILALAGAGGISITASNVTSVAGPAISATLGAEFSVFALLPTPTPGDIVINTNGTVVGGTSGVLLNNFGTGRSTVNNAGVLSATDGPAILAFGAPVTINNSGTLNGFVTLTDGNDVFNNTGRFNAGLGTDFGAGTDVFNNRGILAVTTQAVELAGLETFNNSGTIDLRNGQTGTVLTLPGDYVGSGNAVLALDIENGAAGPVADVLVISGAATGQTGIAINVLGSAGNELALENLVLVDAGAGSSATAFTIATGFEEQGFLRLGVRQDAAANNYVLALGPSLAAYRTTLYAEGMRNLWYKSADSWSRHMASVRNTEVEPGTSYWISAVGEFSERANNRAIAFNDTIGIEDLGYDQDYFGAQLGVDLNGGSGFNFGITGGYLSSTQKFNGSADRVKYNAVNIGAYAGFTSGIVFVNALAKYDRVWADTRSVGGRFDESLEGGVYGGRAEVGLTFGDVLTGFYAEPAASISYIGSNLDRLVTEQGSVEFVEDEGLLGKFGGRVGYAGFTGASLYLGANLVREFAGDDRVNLRTAGRTFALTNQSERNYAEGMLGLNVSDPSGIATGVFEVRYSDGGDRQGFGGSATINFKF